MAELKPVLDRFGPEVMELVARNLFFPTTLRRMWDNAAGSGRERAVRANVRAKRFVDLSKMVVFFLRTGVCELPDPAINATWGLENLTFHNVAHRQGDVGEAIGYEGMQAMLSADQVAALRGTDAAVETAGTYKVFRGQARPPAEDAAAPSTPGAEIHIKFVKPLSTFDARVVAASQ